MVKRPLWAKKPAHAGYRAGTQVHQSGGEAAGWIVFVVEGDDVIYVLAVGNSPTWSVSWAGKSGQAEFDHRQNTRASFSFEDIDAATEEGLSQKTNLCYRHEILFSFLI